jgi:excinuclease ABC subunit A
MGTLFVFSPPYFRPSVILTAGLTIVIVVEHNLDLVKAADWVIDLGPEGGVEGGQLLAEGAPEDVAKVKESYTGQFLKSML